MKIICTLEEYARLIRGCQHCMETSDCGCCPLDKICHDQYLEDSVEFEIVEADAENYEELDVEEIQFLNNVE